MDTRRSLFLALGFILIVATFASVPAYSVPPNCWEFCTESSSCDDGPCYGATTTDTCGDFGLCNGGGSCSWQYGTSGGDTFNGNSNSECYDGLGGDDTIHGNAGNDELYGSDGNDHITGDAGDDILDGGSGDDYLDGGSGYDSCTSGETYYGCPW